MRKGTPIPYVAHLLGVCALVLADGGDEDEGIAGLLHDTLEDHSDLVSRYQLEDRFGARVRRLVEGCTDTPADYRGGPKPPWCERKRHYVEHLRDAPPTSCGSLSRTRSTTPGPLPRTTVYWGKLYGPASALAAEINCGTTVAL